LLEHLDHHAHEYDGFVGFTYLYAPVALGLPMVAERSLVVPTAHDEAPFGFELYSDLFERTAALFCSTPEEEQLIARRWPRHSRTRVVGVGIEAPDNPDAAGFVHRHRITGPYLLYLGRVEAGKGVAELLEFHQAARRDDPSFPQLLLAGDRSIEVAGDGVRYLGRVSEEDKWGALAGAAAVVVPSRWESLSLLTLEAFAVGAPVVASAHSDVLRGQLERSGAGASYLDAEGFATGVREVVGRRAQLGKRARTYARKHDWDKVVGAYVEEMERIRRRRG
jgi:glycosyltransferase involved in cell wall biosynthesis